MEKHILNAPTRPLQGHLSTTCIDACSVTMEKYFKKSEAVIQPETSIDLAIKIACGNACRSDESKSEKEKL